MYEPLYVGYHGCMCLCVCDHKGCPVKELTLGLEWTLLVLTSSEGVADP